MQGNELSVSALDLTQNKGRTSASDSDSSRLKLNWVTELVRCTVNSNSIMLHNVFIR